MRGVVSRNFCSPGAALILGNELLSEADPGYPVANVSKFRISAHTVERIFGTLRDRAPAVPLGWTPPSSVNTAADVFVGYLLLDAIVGNADRHHENWGVVRLPNGAVHLAPTFDHASSLGRNLSDATRLERLRTKDRSFDMEAFARKARSALYRHEADKRPLSTLDAFREATFRNRKAANRWLDALEDVADVEIATIIDNVPEERISNMAAEFAKRLIFVNKKNLRDLKGEL